MSRPAQSVSSDPVRVQNQMDFDYVVTEMRPKPNLLQNLLRAYLVGGAICMGAQAIMNFMLSLGLNQTQAGGRTAVILIFIGALLTGLGVYDQLARFGGAGSAVPITGFANTVVAPAMEFSREGYVLGMSAQLFTISGPVLVYGVLSAVISAGIKHLFGF